MTILGDIFLIIMGCLIIILMICVIGAMIFFMSECIIEKIKDNKVAPSPLLRGKVVQYTEGANVPKPYYTEILPDHLDPVQLNSNGEMIKEEETEDRG